MSSHYRSSRKQYRAGIHVSTSTHMSLVTYACGLWCSCILSLLTSYDMLILRGISRVQLFPCSCVLINSQSCSSGGDFMYFNFGNDSLQYFFYRAAKISWVLLWCLGSKGLLSRGLWPAPTASTWVLPRIPSSPVQLHFIWGRIHLSTGYIEPICRSAISSDLWSLSSSKCNQPTI